MHADPKLGIWNIESLKSEMFFVDRRTGGKNSGSQHRKFAQPKPFTVEKSVKKSHAEGNSNIGSSFGQFCI
jgi:hypothetical protein